MARKQEILALFPGQGSQQVGMGKDFYDQTEIGRKLFDIADRVLGFPLTALCFEGPIEKLTATEVVQPAILTVSTICCRFVCERCPELTLTAAAGHSLGEYCALTAAGALSFEDAVLLVHKRGRYMQEAVPAGQGKMVAVLGKTIAEIEEALTKVTSGHAQVANINAPGQVVVSGAAAAIDEFLGRLKDAKTVQLPVSAPFHCALMEPAARRLAADLDALDIRSAAFPVYSNVSASALTAPSDIRQALKDQVCSRVRWVECIEKAIDEGKPQIAVEFGAGSILTNMLKRIRKEMPRKSIGSLRDALAACEEHHVVPTA